MDIKLLKHYYELKLREPLPFFNPHWNRHNGILGPEKAIELYNSMGDIRYASSTPYHYMMRELSYKLYVEGLDPAHAYFYFDIPRTTALGQFDLFKKRYPLR